METTILESYNMHPVTGEWIYYRYEKGEQFILVSFDNVKTWEEVPIWTTIYNSNDLARFIYGFKAGLQYSSK